MYQVKVKIYYNRASEHYYATANQGRYNICSFWKSATGSVWYFEPAIGTRRNPVVGLDGKFPVDYLINLCRSVWFIDFGTDELPEIVLTKESLKLLQKA